MSPGQILAVAEALSVTVGGVIAVSIRFTLLINILFPKPLIALKRTRKLPPLNASKSIVSVRQSLALEGENAVVKSALVARLDPPLL